MELVTTIMSKLKDILRGQYIEDQMKLITFIIYAIIQSEYIIAILYQDNKDEVEVDKALSFISDTLSPKSFKETLMKMDHNVIRETILIIDSAINNCSKEKSKEWIEFKLSLINGVGK